MILAFAFLTLWLLVLTGCVVYLLRNRAVPQETSVTHITHVSTPRPYRVP